MPKDIIGALDETDDPGLEESSRKCDLSDLNGHTVVLEKFFVYRKRRLNSFQLLLT